MSSYSVQESIPLLPDKASGGGGSRRPKLFYVSAALLSAALLTGLVLIVLWQVGVLFTTDTDNVDESVLSNKYWVYGDNSWCNDGTRAVFWVRRNTASTKWLVRFQGGGLCWNDESCLDRSKTKASYMSSRGTPSYYEFDKTGGIMQANKANNPHFWDWNAAYFSYCSSDMWLGNASQPNSAGWVFNGLSIAENGLRNLFDSHGMDTATDILLLGEGMACAVPLNLGTRAKEMAEEYGQARVGGIADAGWWVNVTYPNTTTECVSEETCPTSVIFDIVLPYINGERSVDPNCLESFGEPHRCLWSPIVYQTRTIPIFISQNLYDISMCQSAGSPLGAPSEGTEYWNFTLAMADAILQTYDLAGVTDTWSAACASAHALESSAFYTTSVKDSLLGDAIYQWWEGSAAEYIDDCGYPNCNPTCVE